MEFTIGTEKPVNIMNTVWWGGVVRKIHCSNTTRGGTPKARFLVANGDNMLWCGFIGEPAKQFHAKVRPGMEVRLTGTLKQERFHIEGDDREIVAWLCCVDYAHFKGEDNNELE